VHSAGEVCYLYDCLVSVRNRSLRSTQPTTPRGTVKWIPAKGQWCCGE